MQCYEFLYGFYSILAVVLMSSIAMVLVLPLQPFLVGYLVFAVRKTRKVVYAG